MSLGSLETEQIPQHHSDTVTAAVCLSVSGDIRSRCRKYSWKCYKTMFTWEAQTTVTTDFKDSFKPPELRFIYGSNEYMWCEKMLFLLARPKPKSILFVTLFANCLSPKQQTDKIMTVCFPGFWHQDSRNSTHIFHRRLKTLQMRHQK